MKGQSRMDRSFVWKGIFFHINKMTEEEKVKVASVCFDGEALAWFRWEEKYRPMKNWRGEGSIATTISTLT